MAAGPGGGAGAPVFFPQSPFWPPPASLYGAQPSLPPLFPAPPHPAVPTSNAFPPLTAAGHPHHAPNSVFSYSSGPGRHQQHSAGHHPPHHQGHQPHQASNAPSPPHGFRPAPSHDRPSPPQGHNAPGEAKPGIGELVWLSSKAGLIKCDESVTGSASVSFQLKDFCDQAVSDLTSVLRPGFVLQYWAHQQGGEGGLVATFVRPLPSKPTEPGVKVEAVLEAPPGHETGPPQLPKDPYNLELEAKAVPVLLEIFKRNGLTYCQLSGFHTAISNCGDDDLYRYVGTSSLKRRQFLERRTHIFHIAHTDTVSLQPAALYTTLCNLNAFLLGHGGAAFLQQLFDHFGACPDIPLEAREMIGEGKTAFLRFLEAHPWIFAVFPSRVFVSARRQLITFDYPTYMHENFGDQDPGYAGDQQGGGGRGQGNRSPGHSERPPPTPTLPFAELKSSTTAFGSNEDLSKGEPNGGGPGSIPPTPTNPNGPGGAGGNHWGHHGPPQSHGQAHHPPPPTPNQGLMGPGPGPHGRYGPDGPGNAYGYGGRGSTDARSPTMGAPAGPPAPYTAAQPPRTWNSNPTTPLFPHPPPGGPVPQNPARIKRFTDVPAQTERPNIRDFAAVMGLDLEMLARYLRPAMVDAVCQTGAEEDGSSSASGSSPAHSHSHSHTPASQAPGLEDLRSETGVLTGLDGLTGYDPMASNDGNLLSKGLLNSLNL